MDPEVAMSEDEPTLDQIERHSETTASPGVEAPAASGWVTQAPMSGPSFASRGPFLIVAWLIAAVPLVVAARLSQLSRGEDSSYALGYGMGTAFVLVAFAALATAIVGLVRDRHVGMSTLRSPLIPVLTLLIAVTWLVGQGIPVPVPTVDPASALRISGPYTIVEADAATTKTLQTTLASQDSVRSSVVRLIKGEDGSVTAIVVADMAISTDTDFAEFRRGLEDGAGHPAVVETIEGRQVSFVSSATASTAVWLEPPLALFVFGIDQPTARAVAQAILSAP
jgi:hypothetical protein